MTSQKQAGHCGGIDGFSPSVKIIVKHALMRRVSKRPPVPPTHFSVTGIARQSSFSLLPGEAGSVVLTMFVRGIENKVKPSPPTTSQVASDNSDR
jgi:hypothetical protein